MVTRHHNFCSVLKHDILLSAIHIGHDFWYQNLSNCYLIYIVYNSYLGIKRKVSKGTGNILQDLISSTVHVEKYAVPPNQIDQIRKIRTVEEIAKCSICLTEGKVLPLASPELEIFIDLAKNEMSFALFSWTLCCSSCQSTLQKLTKLQNEIDNIKMCLMTLIRTKRGRSSGNEYSRNNFMTIFYTRGGGTIQFYYFVSGRVTYIHTYID